MPLNVGLSVYGQMAKAAAEFEKDKPESETAYIRANDFGGIGLTYLSSANTLTDKEKEANRATRRNLLGEIRKDLQHSNLLPEDSSQALAGVRTFLAEVRAKLECKGEDDPDASDQNLESATVKELLDKLEQVKSRVKTSVAKALGFSDASALNGVRIAKTVQREYGLDVFKVSIPAGKGTKPRAVRMCMLKDGSLVSEKQLQGIAKAMGLELMNDLEKYGVERIGGSQGLDVFKATIRSKATIQPRDENAKNEQMPRTVYVAMLQDGSFVQVLNESPNGAVADLTFDSIASDGKSIRCEDTGPNGPVTYLITPFGEVVEESSYEKSLAVLDNLVFTFSYDQKALFRSFDPATVEQLAFLESLIDPKYAPDPNASFFLVGVLVNRMKQVMEDIRKDKGLGKSSQENLKILWKHLGLDGKAPGLNDRDLKKTFTKALAVRIAKDVAVGFDLKGGKRNELQDAIVKWVFSEDGTNRKKEEIRKQWKNFSGEIKRRLDALCAVNGLPYSSLLECMRNPGFVPQTSDFYWKPSDLPVKQDYLKHSKLNGVEFNPWITTEISYFDGGEDSDSRYQRFRFTLDGKDLQDWNGKKIWDPGHVKGSVRAHAFEAALTEVGKYTPAQTLRSIAYLNAVFFNFAPNKFVSIGKVDWHVSVSRFEKNSGFSDTDMRLRLELPTEDGKTLFHELVVHKDGSYRMLEHGATPRRQKDKAGRIGH